MSAPRCHACGAERPVVVPGFASFRRVTSDCKPWPAGGGLAVCASCGLAQAVLDRAWHGDAKAIYDSYTIYHTSGGAEQSVFDPQSGQATSRSTRLVQRLASGVAVPARGRLLDVGCGNGAFLRAFGGAWPQWSLTGAEVNDHNRAAVESIPGVEQLFVGDALDVPGRFDLISLVHVLEHIPGPSEFLRKLHEKLEPGGLLLVEVPDCEANAFMLLVADHASHFFLATLHERVTAAGFEVIAAANNWVAKELTLVARRNESPASAAPSTADALDQVRARVRWLEHIVATTREFSKSPGFGLFGTSIAATWLFAELDGRVDFFVDEDPHRIGRQHLGRPVLAPSDVTSGASVFLALPPFLARPIAGRLASLPVRWHFPDGEPV